MRVATWNINNVLKRLDRLLDWLRRTQPDVVGLQELKAPTASFPVQALEEAGYQCLVAGQRSWNGVALLARGHEPLSVVTSLPGDASDKEARYMEAAINGVLFGCLYLPNENPQPGPKFDYKLRWFERMRQRAEALWASGQPVVLLGDWNVVPTDADIYKPDTWRDNALLQPEARQAFETILAQGWTDALKAVHPTQTPFTFWDYRRNRWPRDAGLRIDHILVGGALTVTDAGVDREERGRENASDHAPVWAEIQPATASRSRRRTSAKTSPSKAPAEPRNEPLAQYHAKRDFLKTLEPAGCAAGQLPSAARAFVIQKHWASRLHYDFRVEHEGVMWSWAVPKGPSYDPAVKQLAIHVEDHPLGYNSFEGTIPKGQYGAGSVIVWDRGTWEPVGDPGEGLAKGKIVFHLHGEKLAGLWELVRISKPGEKKQDQWIFFKKRGDAWARPAADYDVITALPDSVVANPLGLVEQREPRSNGGPAALPAEPDLSQAAKAAMPSKLTPQLATLVTQVPDGTDWVAETKFDGYRMLARIQDGEVRLFTRNGHDWTSKLKQVATAVASTGLQDAWLDGEIVVLNDRGVPDFNRLQNAIDNARSTDITYFLFDVPYLGDTDLRQVPLASRRATLAQLVEQATDERLKLSVAFDAAPADLLQAACQMGLEGIILKRDDSPYVSTRASTWLKLKCQQRQEFVVVGFTDRSNAAREAGGLLLGVHQDGQLTYAGNVGTGWDAKTGRELHAALSRLVTETPTVDPKTVTPGRFSKRSPTGHRWVRPEMVVEVAFGEWTPDGRVRHPVFKGVRTDKPAQAITREAPGTAAAPARPRTTIKVSNPDRVIDPSSGFKKIDLVRYYESIAEWMLPHLKDRPVSLVRAPQGITGQHFFQKHPESKVPGLVTLDPALWPGHAALLAVDSVESLVMAAQLNVVEFHTWNSTAKQIDRPDRFILDLDPGEGVSWSHLQEAALLSRAMLQELGLESWLKTSGGKGLHVVVPLTPKADHELVKRLSQAVVLHMAKTIPQRFVAKAGPANRVGKIFIDYLRNGHGQTTAAAFSARARAGMGVSMTVAWEELGELRSGSQWTIATAREYLSFRQHDPWAHYWRKRQTLTKALKLISVKVSNPRDD